MSVRQFALTKANSAMFHTSWPTFEAARTAASAAVSILNSQSLTYFSLGKAGPNDWGIARLALSMPTADLPADAQLSSGRIKINLFISQLVGISDADIFSFHLVEGNQQLPPLSSDYGALFSQVVKGPLVSGVGNNGAAMIDLDANALSWITPGGVTKFGCRPNFDIDDITPDGYCQATIINRSDLANALLIDADLITDTTARLNGLALGLYDLMLEVTYTSVSEDPVTVRPRYKFQYRQAADLAWTDCPWQYNIPAASAIEENLSGLQPGTVYQYRAVGENQQGIYTSNAYWFTTTGTAPTGRKLYGDINIDQLKYQHSDRLAV